MNQYDKFTGIGSQKLKAKILHVFIFTNHNNTLDKKITITHKRLKSCFLKKKLKSSKVKFVEPRHGGSRWLWE